MNLLRNVILFVILIFVTQVMSYDEMLHTKFSFNYNKFTGDKISEFMGAKLKVSSTIKKNTLSGLAEASKDNGDNFLLIGVLDEWRFTKSHGAYLRPVYSRNEVRGIDREMRYGVGYLFYVYEWFNEGEESYAIDVPDDLGAKYGELKLRVGYEYRDFYSEHYYKLGYMLDFPMNPMLKLKHKTDYIVQVADHNHYLLESEVKIVSRMKEDGFLEFELGISYQYNSDAVSGKNKVNTKTTAGINVTF